MNCPYVYREGDWLVKQGKKKIGDVCNSPMGAERYGGFCAPHARNENTMPEADALNERQRRAATKHEQRERKIEADKISEKISLNDDVLEAMGLKDPCDLAEEYKQFKILNTKQTYVNYNEKMAFARWLETPAHLRIPGTIEEAAKILGCLPNTLITWKTAPEVIDFMNSDVRSRARGLFRLAMYKLGVNIDRGDVKSIEAMMKYEGEEHSRSSKKSKALNIPEEEQRQADEYARSVGNQNREVALKSEKALVVAEYFNKETEQ